MITQARPVTHNFQERLIFILVMLLIFIMSARTPIDSDLWWHLRAGEISWQTKTPVLIDQTSFTRNGEPWINHSWLAEVIFYLIYKNSGAPGISLVVALIATLSMGLVWMCMDGAAIIKAFILVLGGVVASVVWSPRPQIFSLVLMAVCGLALYRYKWKQKKGLWLLPVIFILWSNLHGGYPLGFILIGLMVIGEILNHVLNIYQETRLSRNHILRLAGWGMLSVIAVLLNPNFVQTWFIPFKTIGVEALGKFVSEWQSPDFHQAIQQPFLLMILGLMIVFGLNRKVVDATDLLTVVCFGVLAFMARRNFGPFALVATPVLARYLWPAIDSFYERIVVSTNKPYPSQKIVNPIIIAILVITASLKVYLVSTPSLINDYQRKIFPVGAVEWLEQNKPEGKLFNEYNWGGFLSWVLRDYPVFIDGRTDLYDDEIISQWIDVVEANQNWMNILDTWEVRLVLLYPDRPAAKLLKYQTGWNIVYEDNVSVLYQLDPQ